MRRTIGLLGRWRKERRARWAFGWLGALGLLSYSAPLWCGLFGLDPYNVDPEARLWPPGLRHPLGTDELGRDFLARLFLGGRVSLAVALSSALGSVMVGAVVGLFAAHFRGLLDRAVLRLTELVMAMPRLPLLLLAVSLDPGRLGLGPIGRTLMLVVLLVLLGWPFSARIARAAALELEARPFVEAARASGASDLRVVFRHVLPNAAAPLLVTVTLEAGSFVLYESTLSYLGLGVPPPIPSWGSLLSDGFGQLSRAPLLMVCPGLLTLWAVAALNLAGEALRDLVDPKSFEERHARRWI